MSQRTRLLAVVEADIQQDGDDYCSLRGLMQALYERLLERDSFQIDALNLQISALVEGIQQRAQRRSKVLGAFGLGQTANDMRTLLAEFPAGQGQALQQAWQKLGSLAAECKQLNERNGKLLAMHHEILSQLLAGHQDGQLYSPQRY